jgi:hypothetical protein
MTLEEAEKVLEEVLLTLAKNSVHNKRLTEYADQLEHYIGYLREQEANSESGEQKTDEPKAE